MAIPNTYARRTMDSAARGFESNRQANRPAKFMKRFLFPASLIAICAALVLFAGCHKGSATAISVTLDPNTTQQLDSGHSLNFTAAMGGDTTNKGVSWKLTLNGNTCTGTGCGTLSNATNTSVTYTAPNVSAQESFTLTATSVADPIVSANVTVTVDIAPQFTTTSIPAGAENGVPYNATIVADDGVPPLTYSIASGSLPAGLQLNPTGTIFGTPTFDGPGASQTYNFVVQVTDFNGAQALVPLALAITVAAPPAISATPSLPQGFLGATYSGAISTTGGVPPLTFGLSSGSLPLGLTLSGTGGQITGLPTATGSSSFSVTVTDSAVPTHQTTTVSGSITISNPPVLTISTTSLPSGTSAGGYGALVQAKGGIPPYTWTLTSGQLPAGLSLATQSDNTGLISGNPILAGSSTFTVSVTDSDVNPQTVSATYTIAISSGTKSNSLFSGPYSFLFQGFDSQGPVAVAGTLTSDGNGNITAGFESSNRTSGNVQDAKLTGSYSIGINGADGRGTLHLVATPANQAALETDYQLVLESDLTVRMIENNNTNTNTDTLGTHGAGVLKPVTQAAFTASNLSGNYAFQFSGQDYSSKPMAIVGVIHGDGVSKLTPVVADINDAGSSPNPFQPLLSPSGTFAYSASVDRGAASLLYSLAGKAQTQLEFSYYFVSASDVFFVETDIPSITDQFPRIAGEAVLQQTGVAFGTNSFAGSSVLTGSGFNGSNSTVIAGLLTAPTCDGVTVDASLAYDQNNGGTISSVAPAATTCVVASNGRATFASLDPRLGVAYLTGPGSGFYLGGDAAVTTGRLELQTGSNFATSQVEGSYALSATAPADTKTSSTVGQVSSTGNGSVPGILDEIDAPGTPAHLGQSLLLSLNALATNGRGTMTSNSVSGFPTNLVFYMLSPTQIRLISLDSNPNNTHPDVISLNH
jgi:hypothetical protein